MRTCWLELSDGTRYRIAPGGVLLGRGVTCDVVSHDLHASRRHVLVWLGERGPELVPMGRNRTRLNGESTRDTRLLKDGDRVEIPGLSLRVEADPPGEGGDIPWRLQTEDASLHRLYSSPFRVGSDLLLDMPVIGWGGGNAKVHTVAGALVLEAEGPVVWNGRELPSGTLKQLHDGDVLGDLPAAVVVRGEPEVDAIDLMSEAEVPRSVTLEFLPHGVRIQVEGPRERGTAWLVDAPGDLAGVLLQPPFPYVAGDLIPDAIVCGKLWPNRPERCGDDVTRVTDTLRRQLLNAGINGLFLVDRREGEARFRVSDDADVMLR